MGRDRSAPVVERSRIEPATDTLYGPTDFQAVACDRHQRHVGARRSVGREPKLLGRPAVDRRRSRRQAWLRRLNMPTGLACVHFVTTIWSKDAARRELHRCRSAAVIVARSMLIGSPPQRGRLHVTGCLRHSRAATDDLNSACSSALTAMDGDQPRDQPRSLQACQMVAAFRPDRRQRVCIFTDLVHDQHAPGTGSQDFRIDDVSSLQPERAKLIPLACCFVGPESAPEHCVSKRVLFLTH